MCHISITFALINLGHKKIIKDVRISFRNISLPKMFLDQKFCWTLKVFGPNFFYQTFLDPNFFGPKIVFDFLGQIVFRPKYLLTKKCLELKQAQNLCIGA